MVMYAGGSNTFNEQGPMVNPNPTDPNLQASNSNEFMLPRGEDVKPYSGLPESYRDQLLSFVMPQLQQGVQNLPGNIDKYTGEALGGYRQELDNALKEMIPKYLQNFAKRGVLSSTVASDTLGKAVSNAAVQSSTKGYQTAMEAAKWKTQIPNTLGGLLEYGRSTEDPTVMYRTMADLLASL
jgi:hypothetical protein